jgi:hypothetical protein
MPVKTKAGLIMIIRLVRKYCYGKKVSSANLSPDGIRNLSSLHQSIHMEQSWFNAETKIEWMNIQRVKPFEEDLGNE